MQRTVSPLKHPTLCMNKWLPIATKPSSRQASCLPSLSTSQILYIVSFPLAPFFLSHKKLCIYSFIQPMLMEYYVPGSVLDAGFSSKQNKTKKSLPFWSLHSVGKVTEKKDSYLRR